MRDGYLKLLLRLLLGACFAFQLSGCDRLRGDGSGSEPEPTLSESRRTAVVRAVERVAPTVVGVYAHAPRSQGGDTSGAREFFWRFFPEFPQFQEQWVPRLGSGIVLDSRGYFLTNDHLVRDADALWVILADGRQIEAEVVGTDPSYDLAIIRVANQDGTVFETAPLGDSEDLMVGEWVVALGNPFGLLLDDPKPSVTLGVVSALHRDVKISEGAAIYNDMIQTDAAINPGNSGGPLVIATGEVIGINTFIFTQGGGSLGIGFAIPIKTAIAVAEELILYGRVRGRWIGISVQKLSPPIAAQLGVADSRGLVVWSLERGSPAERSGVRLGDVIRAVNGHPVRDIEEARRSIFGPRVGDTITFTIERSGGMLAIPVTLEALPTEQGS